MALVKEDTRTEPDGSVMVFQYYEDKRLAIIWHGTGGSFGCTMNPKKDPIVGPTTYELYQMLNEASLEYTITGCPHIVFNGERWRVSEQLYPLADSIKKPVQKEGIEKPVQNEGIEKVDEQTNQTDQTNSDVQSIPSNKDLYEMLLESESTVKGLERRVSETRSANNWMTLSVLPLIIVNIFIIYGNMLTVNVRIQALETLAQQSSYERIALLCTDLMVVLPLELIFRIGLFGVFLYALVAFARWCDSDKYEKHGTDALLYQYEEEDIATKVIQQDQVEPKPKIKASWSKKTLENKLSYAQDRKRVAKTLKEIKEAVESKKARNSSTPGATARHT